MDTAERQHLRELAYTMEASFKDDPGGLKSAQDDARKIVKQLRESFKNETDDTLACVAYAGTAMASRMTFLPPRTLADALEAIVTAYPMAAGALAGVYALPDAPVREGEPPKPAPDSGTGQYL